MKRLIRDLREHLLGLIYPRLCILCGMRVAPYEACVCTECALDLAHYEEKHMRASERLLGTPIIQSLSSPFAYQHDSPTHRLIIALKYQGVREVAGFIVHTALYEEALHPKPGEIDLILPVPISRKHLGIRGFNQAGLLAKELSDYYQAPVVEDLILRHSSSTSQTKLSREDRRENARNAYYLTPKEDRLMRLAGKRILLVDDVLTTGATLLAICDLLEQCGVTTVHIFVSAVAIR